MSRKARLSDDGGGDSPSAPFIPEFDPASFSPAPYAHVSTILIQAADELDAALGGMHARLGAAFGSFGDLLRTWTSGVGEVRLLVIGTMLSILNGKWVSGPMRLRARCMRGAISLGGTEPSSAVPSFFQACK